MGDVNQTPEGLVTVQSHHGPVGTLMRLESSLVSRGLTIFARIDHAAGAKDVGMDLRPTQVVIFGSPKSGTPLMQMSETIGLDLPLKMLVRQEANGETILAYDDPAWLASRHGLAATAGPIVEKMQAAMAAIAGEAAAGPLQASTEA
jgi:uncharacterized protein (DUF302 family)